MKLLPEYWGVFGPAITRTIQAPDAEADSTIDLDTGRLMAPPRALRYPPISRGLMDWLQSWGGDMLSVTTVPTGELTSMATNQVVLMPIPAAQWDTITPAKMVELLSRGTPGQHYLDFRPTDSGPSTALFRTREGGMGVIQALDLSKNPKTLRLRYKLLVRPAYAGDGAPAVFPETQPASSRIPALIGPLGSPEATQPARVMSDEGRKLYDAAVADRRHLKMTLALWHDKPSLGTRRVLLFSDIGLKPDAENCVQAALTPEQAGQLVEVLADLGYFTRAINFNTYNRSYGNLGAWATHAPCYALELELERGDKTEFAIFEPISDDRRVREILQAFVAQLDGQRRAASASVLGQLPRASATQPAATRIPPLIGQLGGASAKEREEAQKALVEIGPEALEALKAAAGDKDTERAMRAKAAIVVITWVPQLRKRLLEESPKQDYGLNVPENDRFLEAIRGLESRGTEDAAAAIGDFLRRPDGNRRLKVKALEALGRMGTKPAVAAIEAFETWGAARHANPPAFRFGKQDHAIIHFGPFSLEPLARAVDPQGKTWAVFLWWRLGKVGLWLTRQTGTDAWTAPILTPVEIPGMQSGKIEAPALKVDGDDVVVTSAGTPYSFKLSAALADSDKDGLRTLSRQGWALTPTRRTATATAFRTPRTTVH